MAAVHGRMRLHVGNDNFFIESLETGINEVLVIDRVSQEISLQGNSGQFPANALVQEIYGIFGIIRLIAGPYLIVITGRSRVGEINSQDVWKVTRTEVLPYHRTLLHLSEQQITDNKTYLSMVDHMLSVDGYYYSTVYDLTHSMQRLHNTSPDFTSMTLHERADTRFVWNGHLIRELTQQPELSRFCMPILHGFFNHTVVAIKGQKFDYIIISRRSCFRAGMRYYIRGLDLEGHAANFVETEQIVEHDGNRCSFVQTRGSIPLFWSQRPNLKYKPDPVISPGFNHVDGFQRHFAAQTYNYGKQVLINLCDQKGKENILVKEFDSATRQARNESNNDNVRLDSFDFHRECSKLRWHRLSILVDRLTEAQREFGYFMLQRDGSVPLQQEGVFRTNCIDCLDRTNVVQSLLARRSLQGQLTTLGILNVGERVEDQEAFEYMFKNVWADNADALAKQYAGTGALKTDYTRTGKRGTYGLLLDGYRSAIRYYLNNFYDGFRQDSIDLILGNYIVEETEGVTKPSPLRQERDWKFYALPTIFVVAFSMCLISILIPDENPGEQLMYVLFWGGASVACLGAIYFYGYDFVNKPKLVHSKHKVD